MIISIPDTSASVISLLSTAQKAQLYEASRTHVNANDVTIEILIQNLDSVETLYLDTAVDEVAVGDGFAVGPGENLTISYHDLARMCVIGSDVIADTRRVFSSKTA